MAKKTNTGVSLNISYPSGSTTQPTQATPLAPNFHANLYTRNVVMGRPRKFTDVTTLRNDIADYFIDAEINKAHPNKAGLSLWLGVGKSALAEYATGKYDDPVNDFSEAIKEAYDQIEAHWTQLLGRASPSVGAIFYMKAALGYRDTPTDNPMGGTTINFILPPEIAAKHSLVPAVPDALPQAPIPVPPEDVKIMNDDASPETADSSGGQAQVSSS